MFFCFVTIVSASRSLFIDLAVVYQVESVLFKVDISSIAPHSEPLSTIFAIPPSTSKDEGTESNPIILEDISAEDFSNFIRWVYHVYDSGTPFIFNDSNIHFCLK
jgi:hypothetical protein